jgi:hypothetical protein
VVLARESWVERWTRGLIKLLLVIGIKLLMFGTVYYIQPHIQYSIYKMSLSVFFMLIIITYVAASYSKPVYMNDVDMLRVPNEGEGKMLQLLRRHDAADICPDCELVRRVDSRHCFACNKCVANFDVHCNFLNNCINSGNRMSYLLFLGSILFFLLSLIGVAIINFQNPIKNSRFADGLDNLERHYTFFKVIISLLGLLAIAGIVPIA